ncbi:TVP38/TMEM64 family protein [Candidatus Nitrospira bockiana]
MNHTTVNIESTPAMTARPSAAGKILLVAVFAAAVLAFFYFDLKQYLSLEALKANRDRLLAFTEANYVSAVAAYILLYCVQTAFSLPGAAILTLAGGFLFGSVLGTLYVNVAATSGATLGFLAARYVLRDWVERKFGDRLGPIQEGFAKNAFSYLLTLRLIPIFPFFLVNLVSGLTRIQVGTYVAATAIGIIPGSFVFANAGRQLGSINSLSEIASPRVLGAFALLGLLALVPVVYRRVSGGRA